MISMRCAAAMLALFGCLALADARAQRAQLTVPPLPAGPLTYATAEGLDIRVVVLARGLEYPWSIGFLPNGDKLISERAGRLRLMRNDALLPDPVAGVPAARIGGSAGLGDIAVHPDFEQNGYLYLTYNKPVGERGGSLGVARGVWRDDRLTAVEDIFASEDAGGISRIVFGPDGKLYISTFVGGDPRNAQDPNTLGGKVLRLNDDGSIPDDNPFVGMADHRSEVFTLGHRTPSGLTVHQPTGTVYEVEMGPNGGDEINALVPGGNYGWPIVSLGRDYSGPWQSETFNGAGIEDPVVFWMPSISTSGLDFYTGDALAAWQGDLFVGGMRYGEISGTGQLQRIRFNEDMQEIRREVLLGDLRHRIRDVRQGPDGLLYLLTDAEDGAVLRIEPAVTGSAALRPAGSGSETAARAVDVSDDGLALVRIGDSESNPDAAAGVVDAILNAGLPGAGEGDRDFLAEPVDPDWAPRLTERINAQLANSSLGLASLDVRCRSTSCRVRMDHGTRLSQPQAEAIQQEFRDMAETMIDQGEYELQGFSMSTRAGDPALGESSSTRFILHRRSDNEATAKQ